MLRVSYAETNAGQCWTLCGRLAGAWVNELRSCWKVAHDLAPLAHATIDLRDVTFIDPAGETLLAEMRTAGAVLVASGVAHKHLIETLSDPPAPHTSCKPEQSATTHEGDN